MKPKMLENDVKRQIKALLDMNDVWHFHLLAGLGAFKGLPDIVAVSSGIVYPIEVKRPGGRQSENQVKFEAAWKGNYGNTYILADNVDIVARRMELRHRP